MAAPDISAIDKRLQLTRSTDGNPYAIASFKSNYVLPVSFVTAVPIDDGQPYEMKFQFSFVVPVWRNILKSNAFVAAAYTNQSYWQAYNSELSSPFTETNHEPEIFIGMPLNRQLVGLNLKGLFLGASHQSNGQTPPNSRSWNRLYADILFERGNSYFSFKKWYRIPEEEKIDVLQAVGDDNPDIEDFMGTFEFSAVHKRGEHHVSAMVRHNFQSEQRGAIQLDYSYNFNSKIDLYLQLFSGYGESLIHYNRYVTRIGVGVVLANWL